MASLIPADSPAAMAAADDDDVVLAASPKASVPAASDVFITPAAAPEVAGNVKGMQNKMPATPEPEHAIPVRVLGPTTPVMSDVATNIEPEPVVIARTDTDAPSVAPVTFAPITPKPVRPEPVSMLKDAGLPPSTFKMTDSNPVAQVSEVPEVPVSNVMPKAPATSSFSISNSVSAAPATSEVKNINIEKVTQVPVQAPAGPGTQPTAVSVAANTQPLPRTSPVAPFASETPAGSIQPPVLPPVSPFMPKPSALAEAIPAAPDPLPDVQLQALRTYKNDINHTVETDKITTAKILLAEQKQQDKVAQYVPETSVKKPKNIFALLFGLLFLVGGVGAIGYYAYTKMGPDVPKITMNTASFFLFAFDKEEFVSMAAPKNEIHQKVKEIVAQTALQAKENTYTDIVFYQTNAQTKESNRITATQFFDLYDIKLPTDIARSVSGDFTYGLYKNGTQVEPFLVIGLVDYEHAYDAMFTWEPTLALDMKDFFPNLERIFAPAVVPTPAALPVSATTTASSTPVTATSTLAATSTTAASTTPAVATTTAPTYAPINRSVQFIDVVLSNRDTRALRDQNGSPYFFYTFIDRDKILFAQDSRLIADIVRKIREKQLVR